MFGNFSVVFRNNASAIIVCFPLLIFLHLSVSTHLEQGFHSIEQDKQKFLDELLGSASYDRRIRPHAHIKKVTNVDVNVHLNSIGPIDEKTMEFSANFYFRMRWEDPRLTFTQFNEPLTMRNTERLWIPDVFFVGEKETKFHDKPLPNRAIWIQPNGTIQFSIRLTLVVSCLLILNKYPLDNQKCRLEMQSYSHRTSELYFKWLPGSAIHNQEHLNLNEFDLSEIVIGDCTAVYSTGTFTCIYADFLLQRRLGYYLTSTFVPSFLIVTLSWVAFWIDHDAIPARVTLGLLTVLTVTTQSSGINAQLPRVSYIKAIDVWQSTSLVFVFSSFLQYAIVNVLSRRRQRRVKQEQRSIDRCRQVSDLYSIPTPGTLYRRSMDNRALNEGYSDSCVSRIPSDEVSSTIDGELGLNIRTLQIPEKPTSPKVSFQYSEGMSSSRMAYLNTEPRTPVDASHASVYSFNPFGSCLKKYFRCPVDEMKCCGNSGSNSTDIEDSGPTRTPRCESKVWTPEYVDSISRFLFPFSFFMFNIFFWLYYIYS